MKRALLYMILGTILLASCQKNDYFEDTGVHEANYEGSMMQYLRAHPKHFKKLVEIIDYTHMQEMFEKEDITFFAPQDVSIDNALDIINATLYINNIDTIRDVRDVKPDVWKNYLDLYIIDNSYMLKDIAQVDTTTFRFEGQNFISHNGRVMNAGVMYHNAGGVEYAGYRMVLYTYIRDFADVRSTRINVPVSSSNIKPYNGVVHVLRAKNHVFGFVVEKLYDSIINGGLTED
ncbi:hypothetical protein G5B30_11365 [Sphingobacterium sp. SGG-5]|uniref:fasciclin domain-containing protein n=1 Tax=Sphingobacterium sp. SGG-5 TaxID=2710881 RepID=UPI0013EDFF0F|nr:fasciclin domain-containing protein [Sphingobacterium sp. SGG-5]NGM62512.1 hypothetical protein [Sphingobacterium sp. SGG-5]